LNKNSIGSMTNVVDIFCNAAAKNPDKIAYEASGYRIGYRHLFSLASKAAAALERDGYREQTAVFLIDDELLLLVYMLGASMVGIPFCSISPSNSRLILDETAARISASFILCEHDCELSREYEKCIVSIDRIDTEPELCTHSIREPDRVWQYVLGSGTTGKSKIIPITHRQMLQRIDISSSWLPIRGDDRVGMMVHLNYNAAKTVCLAAFAAGATIVAIHRDGRGWGERNFSILYASVFHVHELLLSHAVSGGETFAPLRVLLVGGSRVSDRLRQEIFDKLTPHLYVRYGINEISSATVAVLDGKNPLSNSVGKPIDGISVEVVNDEGERMPIGTVGHIRIASPGMVEGYLNDEEATRLRFRDGWFYPGDLGCFFPNGELVHCGRSDDMMIYNGINIYPSEIETVVCSHPLVLDAAAFPALSDIHQQIPVCAVVVRDSSAVREDEIKLYVKNRLGSREPQMLFFLPEIPRNDRGKPIREVLVQGVNDYFNKPKGESMRFQPTYTFTVGVRFPVDSDLSKLREWFGGILGIAIDEEEKDLYFARAGLELALKTVQYARLPIFFGEVSALEHQEETLKIKIGMGIMDDIPNKWYKDILNGCYQSVAWMMNHEVNGNNAVLLYRSLEQIAAPMKREFPIGKSTLPLLEEAYRRGIPFIHIGSGIFQLGWGAKGRKFDRSTTDRDSAMGSNLSHNKVVASAIVRRSGLPAPRHGVAKTFDEALKIASQIRWPLVVKPIDQDRGEGVSVGVCDESSLDKAFQTALALSHSKKVIIEQEAAGVCHRIFVAGGELLYAVKRWPKSIRGDGKRTILELVREANRIETMTPPWSKTEPFAHDEDALKALTQQGYQWDCVPAKGLWVALRDIESTRWGGRDEDVSGSIHPANLDIALRAASVFELEVAGVDIISEDISLPWYQNGAIINEVNYAPLLGGGEISRSRIGEYLSRMIKGDGRIRIDVLVGGAEAIEKALAYRKAGEASGIKCFVTSHEATYGADGSKIVMPLRTLYERMRAMITDKRVERLIVVIQNDEIVQKEFILDRIDSVEYVEGTMFSATNPEKPLLKERIKEILDKVSKRCYSGKMK
jgi:cyanophycin synthetase